MIELPCTCQYKKHVLSYDEKTEKYLQSIIKKQGYYKKVIRGPTGKAYKVPIAFIICHGIKEEELDMFECWPEENLTRQ